MGSSASQSVVAGPERETLVERFVNLFRLPYWAGCLLIALLIGPAGNFVYLYVGGFSAQGAFDETVALWQGGQGTIVQTIAGLAILNFLFFYAIYMIRFMRKRIIRAEANVSSLVPGGEDKYRRAFGILPTLWPPILLGAVIFLFLAPNVQAFLASTQLGVVGTIYLIVAYPIFFVTVGTFVWVYFGAVRGIYNIGRLPLKLRPFQEDSLLGVKPIGSLSLSFAFAYFAALGTAALADVLTPNPIDPNLLGLLVVLMILGVAIFFLPLRAIHRRMLEEKTREQRVIRKQIFSFRDKTSAGDRDSTAEHLVDIKDTLANLATALTLEVTKKEIESIPTWPFDTAILSRLAAIILSVATILIAKFVTDVLFRIP